MPNILQEGYEKAIRSKLGAKESELPDEEINQPLFVDLAEATIAKRVPSYASITDPVEQLMLQNAVVAYVCYLIAPSMARRVNQKVSTLDMRWEKEKVNWTDRALEFLAECEQSLGMIESVEINTGHDSILMGIAKRTDTGGE